MGEFRPLFGTFLLSTIGDELARVALTVLVYERTSSPLLSAITFGISYLPWLIGGPLLSTLADRLPRHRVLIVTDAVRALLVAGMAVPGTPLPVLLGLLLLVAVCAPPFESARSALMADILSGERYALATTLTNISLQLAQVVGFAAGGALLAALNPSAALLLDAATFAVSSLWLTARLRRRPAPGVAETPVSFWQDAVEGVRFLGRSRHLLAIIGVLWIGTLFTYGPEGLAAPFSAGLGTGPSAVGLLLAANPLGVTVGGVLITRFLSAERRDRAIPFLLVLGLAPVLLAGLVAGMAGPGRLSYALVVALWFVSGLGSAWTIPLNVSFVQAVPAAYRGRAFGVAVSGLYGVQGLGVLIAGVAAEALPVSWVVAAFGGAGLLAVVPPLLGFTRSERSVASGHPAAAPSEA